MRQGPELISSSDTKWVQEQVFVDVNGHGGVACNISPWMSYVVMQNGTDVQFWWRDSNYTKRGNSTHPIGLWQKGTTKSNLFRFKLISNLAAASIQGISKDASLNMRAYGQQRQNKNRYIITQQQDLSVRGYNMTGQAEEMKLAPITFQDESVPSISIGNGTKALPGSNMAFIANRMHAGRNTTKRTWISWMQTSPDYITQLMASSENLNSWTETHISTAV
jgi:hypothetical protein